MSNQKDNGPGPLKLRAMRAHMGDWKYYICVMKMGDVASRLNKNQPVYESQPLQNLLQRQLAKGRGKVIQEYLITQKERFFNSLVVVTSGGKPKWQELKTKAEVEGRQYSSSDENESTQGFLMLDGSETLFTIDGQHRVDGIRRAVEKKRALAEEEISVIFVKGITANQREKDPEGYQRTRRLFTVLNRYAKPVGTKDAIALDEDDLVAITTRQLVNEYPLFKGKKISGRQTPAIPNTDKTSVTSIITLYQVLDNFFGPIKSSERRVWTEKTLAYRPSDKDLRAYYTEAENYWDTLCEKFPPLAEAKKSSEKDAVAGKYRTSSGGHILFRPACLLICARTLKRLIVLEGLKFDNAINRLSKVPMELVEDPWKNLVWDSANSRMVVPTERQRAAEKMLFHALGGDVAKLSTKNPVTQDALRSELAGLLQVDPSQYQLPKYV